MDLLWSWRKLRLGGKNEVLNLLKEDIESWENVSRLRLKSESGDAFDKKVKKQIPFVLQEEQFKSLISRPEESVNSPKLYMLGRLDN